MVSFFSVTFLALAYISCLVNASPLAVRDDLDVAAPPVTYPTQGVVWTVGQTQTVTWDTTKLPAQITNPIGQVVLGWIDSSGGYNLQLKSPLASGFPITAGKVDITVPSGYPDGSSYIIALIGSSGNISPTFTITSGGGGSPSPNNANPPATTPTPPVPSTSVPGGQPTPTPTTTTTTTPGSDNPIQNNVATPNPTSSTSPTSGSSSSTPSKSSPSSTPSGNSENSNSSSNSSNAAWGNKPVNTMVVSLLAGSLVALFI